MVYFGYTALSSTALHKDILPVLQSFCMKYGLSLRTQLAGINGNVIDNVNDNANIAQTYFACQFLFQPFCQKSRQTKNRHPL